MAAIYSGIHLKLKNPQTSWEDKLKLARFAWISSQCLLPNKEQVLLDWCSHALTGWYNQKVQFSQHVLEGLWCYLDDLLHSSKLHVLLKQGKSMSLRLNMAQLLLQRLQDSSCAAAGSSGCVFRLLSVCQGILSSPKLSSIFTTKYELMVDLAAKFCSLGCRRLQQLTGTSHLISGCPVDPLLDADQSTSRPKEDLRSDVFEVLLQVLSCYLSVQRQQPNPNRVFSLVTNQLLQPLLLLRHLLTSGDAAQAQLRQQLCRDVRVKIDSILQLALFPPEHLTSYNEELLPSREDSGRRTGGAKAPLKPVSVILCKLSEQDYCDPLFRYPLKTNTVPLLFKFFLESYTRGRGENKEEQKMLCFYFLTRLVPALDVGPEKATCSPESWSLALLALESLLTQTLSADLYNIAADRIRHNQVQLNFYRDLAQMLFNQAQPSVPAWYRCLKVLLSLNHLILEPDLDQLLSSAWVDADCMETRVRRVRQLTVSSLLQTYTKLRQLPRLFSELLSVICQPALDDLRPPLLSEGISTSLRNCLLDTPTSQGLEICSLVLDSIKRDPLPALIKEDGDNGDRGSSSLKLLSLSQLLHTILFSLKTLDNTSPVPLVRQAAGLMEEMQQLVQVLLSAVKTHTKTSRENSKRQESVWEQRMQEAALLLMYSWVEVDTLFHIHCSRYTRLGAETTARDETEALMSVDTETSCSPMSRLLLRFLTLQHMKKLLLQPGPTEQTTAALLNRAAHFILSEGELQVCVGAEQVWDRQLDSVDISTYPVAHWHLLTSNLPLLVPHLSAGGVCCVANVLISSLLSRQTERESSDCVTVSLLSSQLLHSSTLTELPSLFSATVCSLTNRMFSIIIAAQKGKGMGTGQDRSTLLSKECLLEDILASSQTGQVCVSLTGSQIDKLLNVLHVLSQLNPDGLSHEDMSSVFLHLLFLLCCSSCGGSEPPASEDAVFLQKLLTLLTSLLEGKNFAGVLKLVHGGSVLQVAVSSLWHRSRGRFISTSGSDWLDVLKAVQSFIGTLVQLIIVRNSSVRLNLQQFTSYLTRTVAEPDPGSVLSRPLLLVALTSFSQTITSHLGRSKQLDQTLTQVLTRTTASLGPAVEFVLRTQAMSQQDGVLTQASVVDVVTIMLRCEQLSAQSQQLRLTHRTLYQGVCQQILKEISFAPRPMDFLLTSLNFLSVFYKALEEDGGEEVDELYLEILQTVHSLLTAPWLSTSDLCELEPAVQELLHILLLQEESSMARLSLLLLRLREGLRAADRREVLSSVTIIKLVSCCQLPESCSKALWLIAPQIISAMVFLVRLSSQDVSLTLPFTVPVVTSLRSLLRQGEGLITNPHHVTLVLGALEAVPLHDLSPSVYQSTFLSLHEALFAILKCHPQVMLNAAPSFLNVFHRLLASIMYEGRQRGDSNTGPDGDEYLQSSRLMERMYSHIAAAAENFTTLAAFMVAEYVTQLQKVTLRADIKQHLTEGIYQILDLCVEQDIKFMTTGLQMGVREVFNELYGSYTHYHKAQRQGEDKYTA